MALKKNSAEGGTNNAGATGAVTTTNSGTSNNGAAFSVVNLGTTGTINYVSTVAAHGSNSFETTQGTAANVAMFNMDDTEATSFAVRFYLRLTGFPSAECEFPLGIRTAADLNSLPLQMTAAGLIRTVAFGPGNLGLTSTALTLNTWYRIEYVGSGLNSAATNLTLRVYAGDSGTLHTPELNHTNVTTTRPAGRMRFGKNSAATLAAWQIDDIAMNIGSSTFIGPEVDNSAPSVPTGLAVTSLGSTTATLSWGASTDNVGVTGYDVTIFGP